MHPYICLYAHKAVPLHRISKNEQQNVLTCFDASLYTAVDAADVTGWELYLGNNELKGRKVAKQETGIENASAKAKAIKILRNGQVLILRDGVEFNVLGTQL